MIGAKKNDIHAHTYLVGNIHFVWQTAHAAKLILDLALICHLQQNATAVWQ